jgi:hypothetical protein
VSKRVASVEIIVVICPTLCSTRLFPDRRIDLRKMLPMTAERTERPVIIAPVRSRSWCKGQHNSWYAGETGGSSRRK